MRYRWVSSAQRDSLGKTVITGKDLKIGNGEIDDVTEGTHWLLDCKVIVSRSFQIQTEELYTVS